MHISEVGGPEPGSEPCRFPKLEECAHFHYERVQLPALSVTIQTNMDQSLHSQHSQDDGEWHMVQVQSGDECWLIQRNLENFQMLDSQLHQCIYDRKISQLPDLTLLANHADDEVDVVLSKYLERFCTIIDNSVNCGPVLNWLQMDNKGHRLLVPSEESRSINTPAVAAAYSVRRYVSQARDELNLEVGDMISVIDMASPGESIWWRGKRGFQVGFFPQHCVHIIGDKVPRNMPLPAPVVGSLALSPIKPVLRKHGKLIAFFRSFILNRPSRRRLKQSGILKERVFGCDLGEHLLNSGHDIPTVLKCCAEFIETHGIVDGIYRLSGVTSNIQKLRNAFDEDRIPNLYTEDILQDIHSVASLLKMYFRELPNPLCTYQLYQSFVNAVQGCNIAVRNSKTDHDRLLKMREAVQKLPPPHYRTLEYLMRHLANVAKHGGNTGMTTRNIAIVWAPNLLRCPELEVGGVAALQGVGVQAVVTEFLICYTDLIFCDNLPCLDRPLIEIVPSPKRSRPKSLAISTPTKLITLEEARSKHLLNKDCGYIEVGGGPDNLPKKYHTIIELPPGTRKRGLAKRSPSSGWRSFFTKSRPSSITNKNRKASTPGGHTIANNEKAATECDLTEIKRKLRTVKSAESLTSGHSEPLSGDTDILAPLAIVLNKPPGHNRSVSHDSYFDTLQQSSHNSSLLDLSEIQLNFDHEEAEMRIFSEDESLVSSPRVHSNHRRYLTRARDEYLSANNSSNPSPKKQARVVLSPDSASRKRTRLEDQLSDIQFIDCNTPDNSTCTTAVVHVEQAAYQPKNKSPRNSERFLIEGGPPPNKSTTPTPQSPVYRELIDSSTATTPGDFSPSLEAIYQKLNVKEAATSLIINSNSSPKKAAPCYENVLTTISIIYKSPTKTFSSCSAEESAQVPLKHQANLPLQEAKSNDDELDLDKTLATQTQSTASEIESLEKDSAGDCSNKLNKDDTALMVEKSTECDTNKSMTDLSLSEVLNSSSEYLTHTSISLPLTPTIGTLSPNVSPTNNTTTVDDDDDEDRKSPSLSNDDKLLLSASNSDENETFPKCDTTLSELYETYDELARNYENIDYERPKSINLHYENVDIDEDRPKSINLIEFSPAIEDARNPSANNEKRKQDETVDDNLYQQVKYFRRSVHEINALLALDKSEEEEADAVDSNPVEEQQDYDSLETTTNDETNAPSENENVYENIEYSSDSLETNKQTIDVDAVTLPTSDEAQVDLVTVNVKQLTDKFENEEFVRSERLRASCPPKKLDDKQMLKSLPPCLRARNLKSAPKTRSLDEEEFRRECATNTANRRKSFDENYTTNKMNTLPKSLNKPKKLPDEGEADLQVHLTHSIESILSENNAKLNRERIEKYKEERRKFLHDKYRSESFKEDKDVLLSRFKVFKTSKDDDKTKEDVTNLAKHARSSIRMKTALFEGGAANTNSNNTTNNSSKCDVAEPQVELRAPSGSTWRDRHRHTFDRERETLPLNDEAATARRISLDSRPPRKEKASPSYCIKDMKAIFESKSNSSNLN